MNNFVTNVTIGGDIMFWIPKRYRFAVWIDVGKVRRLGEICKWNRYTVWVRIMDGAKSSFIIKRHKKKHNMKWRGIGDIHV